MPFSLGPQKHADLTSLTATYKVPILCISLINVTSEIFPHKPFSHLENFKKNYKKLLTDGKIKMVLLSKNIHHLHSINYRAGESTSNLGGQTVKRNVKATFYQLSAHQNQLCHCFSKTLWI